MPQPLAFVLGYLYILVPGVWAGLWFHNVVVCWFHRSLLKRILHDVDILFLGAVVLLPIALVRLPAMRRLLLWQPASAAERNVLIGLGAVWCIALVFQAITSWRLFHPRSVPHLRSRRSVPAPYRPAAGDGPWELHGQTARADCLAYLDDWTGTPPQNEGPAPRLRRPALPIQPPDLAARLPMMPPFRAWNHVFQLDVVEIELAFAALPPAFDGLRVVQVSDIHLGVELPAGYYRHLFATARAVEADLVVLTGDLTAHDHLHREAVGLCAQLSAPLGVWMVRGNHDFYTEPELIEWWLRRAGIGLLSNRAIDIVADVPGPRQALRLAGIEHPHLAVRDWQGLLAGPAPEEERRWKPRAAASASALPAGEIRPFHLVLSHRPDYVRELAPAGADLLLAGHTHGGQWRLPLLGPFILPSLYGRLYAEGFYLQGSTLLYTSRGAGVHTVPFRYRCPPEITRFTLRRGTAVAPRAHCFSGC